MARPRKFDDDAVIDRATELFWRDGASAVSIRDLETALELRAPSIYRRFHSKDQLLAACLESYVDREVAARVRHFLNSTNDPMGGLRAFFTSVLRTHPGEDRLRGCLLTTTAGHPDATTPRIRAAITRGFGAIEAGLRTQVERAIAAGQIAAGTDPEATAKALLLSFQGLLVLARSGADDLAANIDATFDAIAARH